MGGGVPRRRGRHDGRNDGRKDVDVWEVIVMGGNSSSGKKEGLLIE